MKEERYEIVDSQRVLGRIHHRCRRGDSGGDGDDWRICLLWSMTVLFSQQGLMRPLRVDSIPGLDVLFSSRTVYVLCILMFVTTPIPIEQCTISYWSGFTGEQIAPNAVHLWTRLGG